MLSEDLNDNLHFLSSAFRKFDRVVNLINNFASPFPVTEIQWKGNFLLCMSNLWLLQSATLKLCLVLWAVYPWQVTLKTFSKNWQIDKLVKTLGK